MPVSGELAGLILVQVRGCIWCCCCYLLSHCFPMVFPNTVCCQGTSQEEDTWKEFCGEEALTTIIWVMPAILRCFPSGEWSVWLMVGWGTSNAISIQFKSHHFFLARNFGNLIIQRLTYMVRRLCCKVLPLSHPKWFHFILSPVCVEVTSEVQDDEMQEVGANFAIGHTFLILCVIRFFACQHFSWVMRPLCVRPFKFVFVDFSFFAVQSLRSRMMRMVQLNLRLGCCYLTCVQNILNNINWDFLSIR